MQHSKRYQFERSRESVKAYKLLFKELNDLFMMFYFYSVKFNCFRKWLIFCYVYEVFFSRGIETLTEPGELALRKIAIANTITQSRKAPMLMRSHSPI